MELEEQIEHQGCKIAVRVTQEDNQFTAIVIVTTPFPDHLEPVAWTFNDHDTADEALTDGLEKGRRHAEKLAAKYARA